MDTVKDMLDALVSGQASLDDTAARFRARRWPARVLPDSPAQMWGIEDGEVSEADSWGAVDSDSRLTVAQYQVLAQAYENALGRRD